MLDTVNTSVADIASPLRRLLTLAVGLVESVLTFSLHHPASAYLPYFKAALQTCTPASTPIAASSTEPINTEMATGNDQSLDIFLQMLGSNDQFNLDAFRDTIFSQPWDPNIASGF